MTGDLRALRSIGELIERDSTGRRALATVRAGESLVAMTPTNVAAIVDSSLVVCLWDIDERIGAVLHLALPEAGGDAGIAALVEALEASGCDRRRLRAKLFGGSDLPNRRGAGARNLAAAEAALATLAIPVVARDTGGERPRKITVHTDDFSAWVWRIWG
jgi:chemotaxis receptor (MCP) glutamine deamidase CheD